MVTLLTVIYVIVCVLLILFVLLQFGKGAEAGLFTGSSESAFTSTGQGNVLTKITAVLAALFLILSLTLAIIKGNKSTRSLLDDAPANIPLQPQAAPKAPEAAAPAQK